MVMPEKQAVVRLTCEREGETDMRIGASSTSIAALITAMGLSPATAQAQAKDAQQPAAQAEQGEGIAEIVVTAQKRAESVQDVPIAISAFTASSLQERAVGSVSQLSGLAPNVTLDAGTPFSGSPSVLSAFIRGIGSDDFAFNIDPGVGIYVDGVYLARSVGANQDLLDVDRVEILKGPQGTLFGRNTIGGAISIVTRDPGDAFLFKGDVTTGSYDLLQVRGTADIPITQDLAAAVTFGSKTRKGYVKRIPYPDARATNAPSYTEFPASGYDTSDREGGDNNWNLRGKLKWRGDGVSVTLSGDYTREDSTGLANSLLGTASSVPGNFAGTANLPGTAFDPTGTTGFLFAGLYNFCIGANAAQIAARGAQALCGVRGTQFDTSLNIGALAGVNVDATPTNDMLPYDDRFLTGDKDTSYATGNSFSKLTSWGLAGTIEAEVAPTVTVKSITGYRKLDWRSGTDGDGSPLNFEQLSFAMKQWQFSQEVQLLGSALDKRLNFVLGGYYFKEKGGLHDYVTFAEGLLQVDGPNALETENYAAFGQVDWRPIDLIGITVGGRYTHESKQFEGGQQDLNGFNYKLFGCSDANGNISPNGAFPLAPITCQQGTSPTIRNAGNARIKGVEFEAVAAPVDGLTINASVGYIDATYTSVLAGVLAVSGPNPFQAGTFVGAPLPKTPHWKTNVSPRYEAKLGNGGAVVLVADWTHSSAAWNDAQRSLLLRRATMDMVNGSVAYREPGGQWTVTVGATNLTNERYLTTGNANIANGVLFGTYSRPREWYARLGVSF